MARAHGNRLPEEIAERLWPSRAPQLEPLGGGITNRNFKILVDERLRGTAAEPAFRAALAGGT